MDIATATSNTKDGLRSEADIKMAIRKRKLREHTPQRVAWAVAVALMLPLLSLLHQAWAQNTNTKHKQQPQKESFSRPKPTHIIKPQIPSENRYASNRVFLERADSLYHYAWTEDWQVVSGNVLFRQGNMFMYCDSAFYYPDLNSLNAFGNVKMTSGDTLVVHADRMYYDGQERLARLKNGPTHSQVTVNNKRVTLSADSLFYSVAQDRGWYDNGGRLNDDVNTLTSTYGEYSPSTKTADFYGNVHLTSKRNGNQMLTDTLFYNTSTHEARIVSRTDIWSAHDTIVTYSGTYNTQSGRADLTSRSTITHTDSNNNVTRLTGDIIIYEREKHLSRAYMTDNPTRIPRPTVITDTAHKVQIISEYGEYNDLNRTAYATGNPLLIEYSRPDTNYMRADTLFTKIVNRMVLPEYDYYQKKVYAELLEQQKALDIQYDSLVVAYKEHLAKGDSTFEEPKRVDIITNDSRLHRDSIMQEFTEATAVKHGRFFNQQIQAIADTMHFRQYDSLLFLKRKPIVWADNRQITADTIVVHFNDSTVDNAKLVNGLVAEHVAEDFYNQLKGKHMFATFENQQLKNLLVDDNVEVILLPAEKDSTYNKLIRAESEHLSVDMSNRQMDKLKMWAKVDGSVTPLFKLKRGNQWLTGFKWHEILRPKREWYFDRWIWDDDLGDVSDEMQEYFKSKEPSEDIDQYFN